MTVTKTEAAPAVDVDINGFSKDGDYVRTVHLEGSDGMRASILTLGARLLDLRLSDNRPLLLSFSTLADVEADEAYVGVTVGRTANRIRGGVIPGRKDMDPDIVLECNEAGRNHTHGGRHGWDKKLFAVRNLSKSAVELFMYSPAGDQGYPSSVEVVVKYELTGRGEIAISLVTTNVGTEHTVTNMTVHPYFDLAGLSGQARESVLGYEIAAPSCDYYLVLDDHNVPTGEIAPVDGTRFDIRRKRKVADGTVPFSGYDQYFVASDESSLDGPMRSLVTITAPTGDHGPAVEMEVSSNQPGFQMYTANGFDGTGVGAFEKYGSIAVEPSGYIDAGNNRGFPTIALEPSETRRQLIIYRFKVLPE